MNAPCAMPLFSIIIPGFNRPGPLRCTLCSAAAAAARLPAGSVEILLVDDGSTPALETQLADFAPGHPVRHLRQSNQGSIVARLTGLAAARGERVLFLDSDDLIHPDKLARHLAVARRTGADITYDDLAAATLGPDYSATYAPSGTFAAADTAHELLLRVQPPPHSPVYRRAHLTQSLARPLLAPDRRSDAAGDIWLYYNLAAFPARVAKVDAALTAIGPHEETRYSTHWEKLGLASLRLAEAFQRACPENADTLAARRTVGEVAFGSWRRLPRDYDAGYSRRVLEVWRRAPRGPLAALGGRGFFVLATLLGPVAAGRILRLRNGGYAACRTLDDRQLAELLGQS